MLAAVLEIFDSGCAAALKQNTGGQCIRYDGEIVPPARRREIAARRRPAPALARGELKIAGAFLRDAVEIVGPRQPCLRASLDEGIAQRMAFAHIRYAEWPANAVQVVLAALLILAAAEIRQHILEAPPGIAQLAPVVEGLGLSANV